MRFRGSADRVDRARDAITVVDYKAGSARSFTKVSEADPTAGGGKLQLPVYAYAARAAFGTPDAPVAAEYWFLRRDRGKRIILSLTADVRHRYGEALAVIADGLAGGLFPSRPADDGYFSGFNPCPWCDPDFLGVTDLRDRWQRKLGDPRLTGYLRLTGGGP
jgi:RecB family exonuclease